MSRLPPERSTDSAADTPRVPVFRTWRGLYGFVFAFFVLDVVLLAAFTRWFR